MGISLPPHKKRRPAGNHIISLLVLLLCLFCIGMTWQLISPAISRAQTFYQSIQCPTPDAGKSVLQMIPCTPSGPITLPPQVSNAQAQSPQSNTLMAGPVCTPDSTIANGAACKCQGDLDPDAVCTVPSAALCGKNGGLPANYVDFFTGNFNPNASTTNGPIQCIWEWTASVPAQAQATNCTIECNSKPVLYFYSPKTLSINVMLAIPGVVTASNPHYPTDGWQNVIIHPKGTADGTLLYNAKTYNELYYEDATIKADPPTQGFVIKTTNLASSLQMYTAKLGLNENEQNEFIAYWVPRLKSLKAPYIFFSVFDQTQKERVDHVVVTPVPQTTIAFLAYFKPLAASIQVAPLQFQPVPKRLGFTMVEWGGTIETQ